MKAATVGLLLSFLGCVRAFQSLRSPLFARPSRQPPLIIQLRSTLETRSINPTVEEEEEAGVGAWIPIASRHALRGLGPQQIRVMGVDFVVWEHNETWSVMADTCPHRLAPLSQGRVDPDTGSIACPYHGWQFNAQGTLTKLPQADPNLDITKIAGTSALCFPTHVAGDMIFAFLPSSMHGEMFLQSTLPEVMFPTLREEMKLNKSYFVRELPYSADFCIENFMDPSHIPFAHHSLQGSRSDATPIPTEVTVSNFTHIETSFQDVVRGNRRM
jgi:phenylpropionate dioxygenase-like ring-hydroxylating dioxygenase large terminal subunit